MRRVSKSLSLGKVLRFVRKTIAGILRVAHQFRLTDRAMHPNFFAPLGVKFHELSSRINPPRVRILNLNRVRLRRGISKFVRRVVARVPADPDGNSGFANREAILKILYRFKKRNSRQFSRNCAFCFCSFEGCFLPRRYQTGV